MVTPAPARRWVALVAIAAVATIATVAMTLDAEALVWSVGAALVCGVALASLFPIRYRFGGSTHAVTADEPFLLAMLIAIPPAFPPVLFALGALVGNLAKTRPARIPAIRVIFNVGSVALSASAATVVFSAIRGEGGQALTPRSILAVVVAMVTYMLVSTGLIGVLFSRLGLTSFREAALDVLAVGRVPFPLHLVAGIALGWLATLGFAGALVGVAIVIVGFVTYRTAVGVRILRSKAARLRDVAVALVAASGSMDAFDEALRRIAEVFGAQVAELHLLGRSPRWIAFDGPPDAPSDPTRAAAHALTLERAASLAPGTVEGGPDGALVAPLRDEDGVVGVLALHARRGLEPWDDADEDVLDGIVGEILVALRNAELVEEIAGERERLAAQSHLLGGILDAVSDGIAMVGVDGRVLAWNPGMTAVAGIGEAEALGKLWAEVVRATDEAGDEAAVRHDLAAATAGATIARTWRVVPPIGDDRFVRIVLTPVTDPDRPGVVIVARDVTAAREVDRVKADFIATVSHELRTPLTPLKGFLELSERRELTPAMQVEMRTSMRRQIQRLESLVDDLLAMAELDRDLVDLNQSDHPLGPILRRLPEAFAEADPDERLEVQPTDLTVSGDPEAVERILEALVSNALKHTTGPVRLSAFEQADGVVIAVRDDGPGIAISDQEAIFERFHRLGDHLHRTQGPGLGLPIARALARRLGGDVTVDSAPTRGSSFLLRLPAVVDPGAAAAAG